MQPAEQVAELTEAATDAQSSLSRTKKQRRRRRAAADAGATADAEPAADAGALEAEDAAQASIEEDLVVPEPLVAEELQHRGTTGAWAVVQGLQNEKYSQYNGRIVRVGNQRTNGRFETVRPGSNDKLAVRPENLRWLLGSYDGRNAGDDLADEDDGYGELVLLGFDTVKEQWACNICSSGKAARLGIGTHGLAFQVLRYLSINAIAANTRRSKEGLPPFLRRGFGPYKV